MARRKKPITHFDADNVDDLLEMLRRLGIDLGVGHEDVPPSKPDHGIKLNRPRSLADFASSLHRLGVSNVYRTNDQPTVIAEIHSIKLEVTTANGETKEIWLGLTGYHGPAKKG